jgi:hypothetical protein
MCKQLVNISASKFKTRAHQITRQKRLLQWEGAEFLTIFADNPSIQRILSIMIMNETACSPVECESDTGSNSFFLQLPPYEKLAAKI